MDLEKLNYIRRKTLEVDASTKPKSDEFAGVYLHSGSPFRYREHIAAFHSFRAFSQYNYPIYFLISPEDITEDVNCLISKDKNIIVVDIPRLNSVYEFNMFSIYGLLHFINPKHNNLLYFQYDGHPVKSGWENYVINYDWLGAPWKEPIQVIENKFGFGPVQVGNGGANFRKRDKCLQVLELLEKNGGQDKIVKGMQIIGKHGTEGPYLAEDIFFSWFGFGAGIFKPTSIEEARKFSIEPITLEQFNNKDSFLFHKID